MNESLQVPIDVIRESAEVCRNAARHILGAELGCDEESLRRVDALLSQGWSVGQVSESSVQTWGCFVGECLCRILDGEWVRTESGLGVRVGQHVAHPLAKVEKRLRLGTSESVTLFFESFKAQTSA